MLDEPLLDGLLVISRPSRRMLLFGSLAVFFVQFLALGVPAPFLPTSPAGIAVGPHAVGVIFSSFPLGTVLVGPLVPRALEVFGARLVVSIGLVCSAVSALAFALVPTLLSGASPLTLTATFAACRLFGGASAAACETGTFTVLCMSVKGEAPGRIETRRLCCGQWALRTAIHPATSVCAHGGSMCIQFTVITELVRLLATVSHMC